MRKIDLKRELGLLYRPPASGIVEVEVPAFGFLMVDGRGDPDASPAWREAVEALFAVAYTLKFALKKQRALDYVVMPLEASWWSDDLSSFVRGARDAWQWTAMIMQPPEVDAAMVAAAVASAGAKKALPALGRVRLETLAEGRCAQLLHVGPYAEEGPAIARLHEYIRARSALRGRHHEIYLNDARRIAPAKWKTILRQPMA